MITFIILIVLGVAGAAFYLFNQRKGADAQNPHQDVPAQMPREEKRTGSLD